MEDDIFQSVYEAILQRDTRYDGRYLSNSATRLILRQ